MCVLCDVAAVGVAVAADDAAVVDASVPTAVDVACDGVVVPVAGALPRLASTVGFLPPPLSTRWGHE